jgi:hypothetical protein
MQLQPTSEKWTCLHSAGSAACAAPVMMPSDSAAVAMIFLADMLFEPPLCPARPAVRSRTFFSFFDLHARAPWRRPCNPDAKGYARSAANPSVPARNRFLLRRHPRAKLF